MSSDEALVELLRLLKASEYRFTAVTPATHGRVIARRCEQPDLRDIFGWNRPFGEAHLPRGLLECLDAAAMLAREGEKLRSRVRVASLGDDLFLHSAYPTTAPDSVFFGPDTYRFARFVSEGMSRLMAQPRWIVDMGAGSGAGAILAARLAPSARVTAVDVNPEALRFTKINAEAAAVNVETQLSSRIPDGSDLVIANPPYIMDPEARTYRDGGGLLGGQVALDWATQALRLMTPGGTTLLYTGAAVTGGETPLLAAVGDACDQASAELQFEEIDPDVFGEELEQPPYRSVERIALVCATIRKP